MNCKLKYLNLPQKALATYFLREAMLKNIKPPKKRKKRSFDLEDLISSKLEYIGMLKVIWILTVF